MRTEADELRSCAQTRSQGRERGRDGGKEGGEEKDNPQGLWAFFISPPESYSLILGLFHPPFTLAFPYNFSILSGDFQQETMEIKDFNPSEVSATCHMRRKNTLLLLSKHWWTGVQLEEGGGNIQRVQRHYANTWLETQQRRSIRMHFRAAVASHRLGF